ncbi:hypothetical protein ACFV9D_31995 [Streptomyces sp. NPDC059875]|uniref:hypothetical protein n=1 Tax=unclassified Streptomyces TaxID=2593676 RepID=UPI00365A7F72
MELVDRHHEVPVEVIEAKAEHREPPAPESEEAPPAGKVVDLMAALEESVLKAKAARSEAGGRATVHEMPQPKNKAAAKRAPARKPASKTASAQKTAPTKAATSGRRKSA